MRTFLRLIIILNVLSQSLFPLQAGASDGVSLLDVIREQAGAVTFGALSTLPVKIVHDALLRELGMALQSERPERSDPPGERLPSNEPVPALSNAAPALSPLAARACPSGQGGWNTFVVPVNALLFGSHILVPRDGPPPVPIVLCIAVLFFFLRPRSDVGDALPFLKDGIRLPGLLCKPGFLLYSRKQRRDPAGKHKRRTKITRR